MTPVEDCEHPELTFGSGDYYIFCYGCGARWVRGKLNQLEYGRDTLGNPIGGAPEECRGKGLHLSGQKRIAPVARPSIEGE